MSEANDPFLEVAQTYQNDPVITPQVVPSLKVIELKRVAMNDESAQGVLIYDRYAFALSLELPWKDNKHNISCVLPRAYLCQREVNPHLGEAFRLINVSGRDSIFIHKANFVTDLKGCIGIGEEFDFIKGKRAILDSGHAYSEFMNILKGQNQFRLVIKEV